MRPVLVAGTIAAIVMAGTLVVIDAYDFSHDPPTDTADVVATLATLIGAAIWLGLRWVDSPSPTVQLTRAVAAGAAIGALATGLASVVYDPFAAAAYHDRLADGTSGLLHDSGGQLAWSSRLERGAAVEPLDPRRSWASSGSFTALIYSNGATT